MPLKTVGGKPVPAAFVRRDRRGSFVEVVGGRAWRTIIHGSMRRGARMGDHYHKRTTIFFWMTRGSAVVREVHARTGATRTLKLQAGQGCWLEPWWSHAIVYKTASDFLLLKSRAYSASNPDTFAWPVP